MHIVPQINDSWP